MRKKLPLIIGMLLLAIIIIIGIILGIPIKEENQIFSIEEPILYIKSNAEIRQNTDIETLNTNYINILRRNGLKPEDISLFITGDYTQKENIYLAKFISKYKDTYIIGFNLDTNEISLKKLTEEEIAEEIFNTKETEL